MRLGSRWMITWRLSCGAIRSGPAPSPRYCLSLVLSPHRSFCWAWRNPKIPKVRRTSHQEIAVPEIGTRNRSRFQDRLTVPEFCRHGSPRSFRSILGWSLRRHKSVCDPRKKGNHHAKGHPVGKENSRRTCISDLVTIQTAIFIATHLENINSRQYPEKDTHTAKTATYPPVSGR